MALITFEYWKKESENGQSGGRQQVDVGRVEIIDYLTLRRAEHAFLDWFQREHPTQALLKWKAMNEKEDEVLSEYGALIPSNRPRFPPTPASTFHEQRRKAVGTAPPEQQLAHTSITDQEKQILTGYGTLMNEVKYRLKLVLQFLRNDAPYPEEIMKEFCFLQIRMVCELIGLGCLIAHAGINGTKTRQLKRAYSPERIVSELEKLHPDFFPTALGPQSGFLTKDGLVKLHGLCGQVVHRGSIERFLAGEDAPLTGRKETLEWTQELLWLVNRHVIYLSGMDKAIVCTVDIKSDGPAVVELRARPVPAT